MEVFRIRGGTPLRGEVRASGSKNAALPAFAAALLTSEPCVIENVPDLSDVRFMAEILRHLGAEVEEMGSSTWRIMASEISPKAPYELVRKMRASICLLGPLVARLGKARVALPGGCVIGQRPIDLHLKALSSLGCDIEVNSGDIVVDAKGLCGSSVFLGGRHGSTVTGTANAIMAAVLAPGVTRLESAACEPEIANLCQMLLAMGARIENIGGHHLTIHGVESLGGCRHRIIADRIEVGTYCIAAAITGGDITVTGADASHLGAFLDKMEQAGVRIEQQKGHLRSFLASSGLNPIEVTTLPYPGYPTDLQAQACALACLAPGPSILTERVYPNRFMHAPELERMGAEIAIEGSSAIVKGNARLSGAPVMASDLRASAALILAALAAKGDTWVQRIYHLDRGYETFDDKLRALGAEIERLPAKALPNAFQSTFPKLASI
jgi:UDP-N-acetylglucosamine 1-carboxyvinyltransferase